MYECPMCKFKFSLPDSLPDAPERDVQPMTEEEMEELAGKCCIDHFGYDPYEFHRFTERVINWFCRHDQWAIVRKSSATQEPKHD